ncbi:exo-alpha-sialidase [Plantactinospora mayteni]|uniref:Glycosyl hydrolase n=1 Tax=Plantactinospora mayteni TaxID=566021 RepID=A0ABQ4F084_9ACTN|nr:exo-alpha-sialidase [Plantactinospora mayteni]GIH00312.1 glycosyl hydrolase [Plantactinospora mayteni]
MATPLSTTPDRLRTDGVLRDRTDQPGRADAFLPVPAVQNHSANLMPLANGDLGCVWFGGTQEGVADISIWMSRLTAGSDTWSTPVQLSDDPTRSEQNPVLFPAPTGDLWLLHTAQLAGNQDTSEIRYRVSTDDGHTWSPTRTLFPATDEGGVFVRQPILVLDSGRWLLPVFHCVRTPGRKWVGDHDTSSVMISDDQGRSWRDIPVPHSTGCVHMNIQPADDGSLRALFRSRWADFVYASRSDDGGETWSAPTPTGLPNNNSSIQYVRLAGGRLALVYNHSSAANATDRRVSLYDEIDDDGLAEPPGHTVGERQPTVAGPPQVPGDPTAFWGAPRAPLSLTFSTDDGATWPVRRDLEVGDGYCLTNNSRDGLNREYSYPSVQQTADGDLHVAFTYYRQAIKHVRLRADQIGWAPR